MTYVDCDSHILPEDAFADVPAAFRQEGPRIETDAKGRSCVIYPARQRNIPDYARTIPNPFNPRPRSSGNKPEVRIADMAKAKIDLQVLVPSNGSFYYDVEPELGAAVCRSYNNAIGRIVKEYPGKFLGLATLPMQAPQLAVDELDRAVRQLGLQGVVCYTTVGENDLDGEEFWPFYAKAEELAIPIIFHPVNTGPIVGGWRMTRHYVTRGYGFWSALGNSMENSITIANLMDATDRSNAKWRVTKNRTWLVGMVTNPSTSSTPVRIDRLRSARSRDEPARSSRFTNRSSSLSVGLLCTISSATFVIAASVPSPASMLSRDSVVVNVGISTDSGANGM